MFIKSGCINNNLSSDITLGAKFREKYRETSARRLTNGDRAYERHRSNAIASDW